VSASLGAVQRHIAIATKAPASERRGLVAAIMPDLEAVIADPQVTRETALALATRAARALDPRTPLIRDRGQAVHVLRQALADAAEEPRGAGRPGIGPPTTIRLPYEVYDAVDEQARRDAVAGRPGVVDGAGQPIRAAMIRVLVDEALTARAGRVDL
jgi:hypothetical protein